MTGAGREATILTLVAAASVTLVDGVLLALQRGFFSAGFLAQDSATSWSDRLLFIVGSMSLDVVGAGLGVVTALSLAGWLGWGGVARRALALTAATCPLLVASLTEYQVLARLGDAFDIGLMFDLVGRRPVELLAVSWAHLVVPVVGSVVVNVAVGLVLRSINRRYPSGHRAFPVWRGALCWFACALFLTGLSTTLRLRSDVQDNGLRRKPAGQALGAIVTFASDLDRDGYGLLSRPGDPAPFDSRIHPFAIDVPGNGIDEDGIAGDLPAHATKVTPTHDSVFARKPPVVMVMLESFRADLLGARESGRDVTPVLNQLRLTGGAATLAFSHNGYTVQSRFHLFTGALTRGGEGTLLDDFKRNNYHTAYFSGQDESFGGPAFAIGAETSDHFYDARQDRARRYTTFTTAGSLGVSHRVVLERVQSFLASRDADRPLFLYVNFYDTHFPYSHDESEPLVSDVRVSQRDIVEARADDVRRMYRNMAANVDKAIGVLRDAVRLHTGLEPVVIVLADHGESLFEGGFLGHGYVLNDVQTRIPLVASGLALDLCEPVGQADLRAAIVSALARPGVGGRPTFRACEGHAVFQYLGTLHRPRMIGYAWAARRLTYDVRAHRVQLSDGDWIAVSELDGPRREEWLALVHQWERLRTASDVVVEGPS